MFKTKYKINNHNQLIDLNGDSINFELTFDIQSNPNDKFEILVVDQNTLDTNENFIKTEYKKSVNGNIQGSVKSDINKYQNFFIIIKSENEVDVEITINKKEIETQQCQTQNQSYQVDQQNKSYQLDQQNQQNNQPYQQNQQYQENQPYQKYQENQPYQKYQENQNYQQIQQTEYQPQNQNYQQIEYQPQNQTEYQKPQNQQFDINKYEETTNEKNKEKTQYNKDSINWNIYIFLFIICLISGSIYIYLNKKKSNNVI